MNGSVDEAFPHVAKWVKTRGWIEVGYDDFQRSFIRALDSGGMIWEGREAYDTLESALQELEHALAAGIEEIIE